MIIQKINEMLRSKDRSLHNIAIELSKKYYPKWNLKVFYGTSNFYRGSIALNGHVYKDYCGKYHTIYHDS